MRRFLSIPVLALWLAAVCVPVSNTCSWAQQQQQPSSAPGAPPPPPPQPPSMQPDKSCSAQAQRGSKGPWKTSSTCPPQAQNNDAPSLGLTQSAAPAQPRHTTADDNPFPEDVSAKAAAAAKEKDAEETKPASSGDTPAPNAGESSSREKLDKVDNLLGDKDSRISDGAGGVIYNPKLASDDVHVGEFYLNRQDYKGAYERFKEASQADPGNPEAIFDLAQAARKMNRNDEALQNYQLYLDALPDGPRAKDARKGLHDLSASTKH